VCLELVRHPSSIGRVGRDLKRRWLRKAKRENRR
jgi:hypothetical protein